MRTTARPITRFAGLLAAAATVTAATAGPATAAPGAAASAPAASTSSASSLLVAETPDERIARALKLRVTKARFGSTFSGMVMDAESGRRIWSRSARTELIPASNTKLVTAHNALTVLGPDRRITTYIRQGTTRNRVIVEGRGDPSLSSAALDRMAATTAESLIAQGLYGARVSIDDDYFVKPSLATGWKSSYVPDSVTPIRALVRDQRDVSDTSTDVGRYFVGRLKAHGMRNVLWEGRTHTPRGNAVITRSRGSKVSTMVRSMLLPSDNEIAETLHKLVSRYSGTGSSWDGARSAQKGAMDAAALDMGRLYDGSGLSRSNRLSTLQLVQTLDRLLDSEHSEFRRVQATDGMALAARTGTLATKYHRFTSPPAACAAGKVWAKTGTLSDVVSLTGYTTGRDGRVKVFSFVVNGKSSSLTLKQNMDMLAATVTGCR